MPQSPVMDEDKLRTVARRRLIGAAVLVGLTVLIFPWVFKQQPRPLNDDLIIEVPRKEAAKPWANSGVGMPAPATQAVPKPAVVPEPAPVTSAAAANEPEAKPDTKPDKPNTTNATTNAAVAAAAGAAAAVVAKPASPAAKPAIKLEAKPEPKPAVKAETKPAEPKPEATTAQAGRFVVQVAAFSDANKARDTRIKLEAQGYKTYSQAIDSPKGKVWRVRVGPYGDKAEAEKAKAQLTGKGFAPALLEL